MKKYEQIFDYQLNYMTKESIDELMNIPIEEILLLIENINGFVNGYESELGEERKLVYLIMLKFQSFNI